MCEQIVKCYLVFRDVDVEENIRSSGEEVKKGMKVILCAICPINVHHWGAVIDIHSTIGSEPENYSMIIDAVNDEKTGTITCRVRPWNAKHIDEWNKRRGFQKRPYPLNKSVTYFDDALYAFAEKKNRRKI